MHILVNASGQKFPAVANWDRKATVYMCITSSNGSGIYAPWVPGTWAIKVELREEPCWDHHHREAQGERRTNCMLLDPWLGVSFYLIGLSPLFSSPLAPLFPPSPHFLIPFSLCASHLLLNRSCTIDFGFWSCLHHKSGRGISQLSNHSSTMVFWHRNEN